MSSVGSFMSEQSKELTRRFLSQRHGLLAFIHALVRDLDVAEEILQEVWIRLAEAVERGAVIQHLDKWCRGVARNLILHHFRARRSTSVITDSRLVDAAAQAFDEYGEPGAVWSSRRDRLFGCIEALPEKSRELLRLKFAAGLTTAEIGRQQSRSVDAILKTLSRIRQLLRECVEARRLAEGADA